LRCGETGVEQVEWADYAGDAESGDWNIAQVESEGGQILVLVLVADGCVERRQQGGASLVGAGFRLLGYFGGELKAIASLGRRGDFDSSMQAQLEYRTVGCAEENGG
jgi:hypothetical protein